jgi:hypothetical protein
MGQRDKAQEVLGDLLRQPKQKHHAYWAALIYFVLGDRDRGFEQLERACEERDESLGELKIDPFFDEVRSDPRFTALLKKIGLIDG